MMRADVSGYTAQRGWYDLILVLAVVPETSLLLQCSD